MGFLSDSLARVAPSATVAISQKARIMAAIASCARPSPARKDSVIASAEPPSALIDAASS